MVDAGVTAVAMEVSSHALALSRVDGIDFDVAVFTNLTQDHLDFHGTMDAYREAKRRLFALLAGGPKPGRTAVVNADDPSGVSMVAGLPLPTLTYGIRGRADVRPARWTSGAEGIRMSVRTPAGHLDIASPLVGEHNVMNLLAAAGVGRGARHRAGRHRPRAGLRRLRARAASSASRRDSPSSSSWTTRTRPMPSSGRSRRRGSSAAPGGRLAVVFGCGGDRDRGKRPLMGAIASRLADRVWVTSDNPRSERPEAIIADIVAGIPAERRRSGARPA